MSKKSKKERKAAREAQRAAVRRQERQRNLFTVIVVGIVVALGGVLVWISLDDDEDLEELLAELEAEQEAEQEAEAEEVDAPAPTPQPPADPAEDERPVACDGELPERAGETKPVHDEPEQVTADGVDYQAVVETSCGTVVIDLDAEGAPEGVNAFVFLATTGFYDGLEIFRHASSIEVFQTGAGNNQAAFSVGYHLPDELDSAQQDGYPPGAVAYANAGPGTSGSQFFLVYGDGFDGGIEAGGLQPIYTRFGQVVEGLDVLEEMSTVPLGGAQGETPEERFYMHSVTILADGEALPTEPLTVDEPEPEVTPVDDEQPGDDEDPGQDEE